MSSLRKSFSSNSMLTILQIYFCLSTTWTFVQAEYYKLETVNEMSLISTTSDLPMYVRDSAHLFIKRHDKNSYTAQLEEIDISMYSNYYPGINSNISGCSSFKPVANALRKPFKVFLDDSGKFKSIKVNKDDVDLSIARKYFLASLLQINKQKLQKQTVSGNEFSFDDNTLSHLGKCDATNIGSKVGEQKYELISIKKLETCRFESSAYKNDKQYLDNICDTSAPEKTDLLNIFEFYDIIKVHYKDEQFSKLEAKDVLRYRSWKNSLLHISTSYETHFVLNPTNISPDLRKRKGSSRDPEPFNDDDSKEITELQYINIDRSIIEGRKNYVSIFYKALACRPLRNNEQLAIFRERLKCLLSA